MRYVCDACERLVEPERAAVGEGGRVELYCPRCHQASLAAAAPAAVPARQAEVIPLKAAAAAAMPEAPAAALAPVVPASERCPKCAAAKNGRESCAKCGLVFELYRPESDPGLESLRREFEEILARWGEPAAREAVDRAGPMRVQTLARLCRHHLADFPDDARAQQLLALITERSMALAATAVVAADPAEAQAATRRWAAVGVLVVLALLVSLVASVLHASPAP